MLNSNEENSWLEQYKLIQEASYKRAVDLYAMCEASNRLHHDLDKFFPRHYALEAVHFGRNLNKCPFEIATDLENAVQNRITKIKKDAEELAEAMKTGKMPDFMREIQVRWWSRKILGY